MPTIRDLARAMSDAFETDTRTNGDKFVKLRDGRPDWMQDVCFKAHGDMAPDDYRYQFIKDAVDALAENDDEDSAREGIEADVYTSDLTAWLNSRNDRVYYLTEMLENYSPKDGIAALSGAQECERHEVFGLVLDALRELADGSDDDETDESASDVVSEDANS